MGPKGVGESDGGVPWRADMAARQSMKSVCECNQPKGCLCLEWIDQPEWLCRRVLTTLTNVPFPEYRKTVHFFGVGTDQRR